MLDVLSTANPFTAATFVVEKMKEYRHKKADKIEPNGRQTLALHTAPHKPSAAAMVFEGGNSVQRAGLAAAAPADKAPADEAPADTVPAISVSVQTPPPVAAAPCSLASDTGMIVAVLREAC